MAKKSILRTDLEKAAKQTLTPEQRAELNRTEKMVWVGLQVEIVEPLHPKPKKRSRQQDAG